MSTPLGAELEIISVTQSLKFPRFQDVPNNQLMLLLLFPTKIIPPPCAQRPRAVYSHRQYLNAKVQKNNLKQKKKGRLFFLPILFRVAKSGERFAYLQNNL